ncbi:MAG: PDZ domain-containing protein [Bacteroidales bacterium]|nr:PDZ domain-containing protein [Bacteroidales bacterium]
MKKVLAVCSLVLLFAMAGQSEEIDRLFRFPAIHGDQVVFTYAGDLYTVSNDGGIARELTNHKGYEMFARFSPDGKHIAFTGQYDGNTEVYLMPAKGGHPERLTYTATLDRDDISDRMGPNNIVMTWTPDGKEIVYRSRRYSYNSFKGDLFKVSVDGGLSEQLPLAEGGFCSYSPDGKKLAFNKVFREFRTWKYYKGGMADDIRIFDLESKEITKITDHISQDIIPMWHEDDVYFISDRDRTMNLFVYHTDTKEIEKVTNYTKYDIKFPSIGKDAIVYENGGYIYRFDLATQQAEKIDIEIANDQIDGRDEIKDASEFINSVGIAPDGKRLVVGARGDIFTVPAIEGQTRNLTKSSGSHDRNGVWSPNGKYVAYLSDQIDEYEIYIQKQDGSEEPIQLTTGADTYKFSVKWSPDSKKLLWSDKKLRLRYVDVESKKVTDVAQADAWEIRSFNWSPDSKWITYAKPMANDMGKVMLYSLEEEETYPVTKGFYSSGSPVFDPDGKYLFFTSNRDFNPIYSQTEWNHVYRDMSKIYLVTLAKDTESPFAPENDEVEIKDDEEEENENGNDKEEKETEAMQVDIDGLQDRITVLPIKASNYWNLSPVNGKIYYNESSLKDKRTIKYFDLDKEKETELGKNLSFSISDNGKKMLVKKGSKYAVIDLPMGKISLSDFVDLSEVKVKVDLDKEWKQIYDESWRQMRDFFYVENMHGLDWKAMHDKYAKLLPYVNNRNDLNYLIGEMIAELSVGHAYVNGGDKPEPERIYTGLLGAQFSRDKSGYFKVEKILKGENFRDKIRSPLTEIGVDVSKGDYIIAINGESTENMDNLFMSLVDEAGDQVVLTVNDKPNKKGAHDETVIPIKDESELYYYNWVQDNIRKVDEATDGQVGYIHVPDMGRHGLNKFAKYFYPQLNKKALIIDDRGNGGGNVSPMLIERLRREVTRANMARNVDVKSHTPTKMILGPMVLLINEYSASDGDLFPYSFKKHDMGKVIGVRTWGGVVGIRGSLPFVDGGDLRKPEFASYSSKKSEWIIEGHGVEPDIVVENNPYKEFMGEDQQLNKAIEVILEDLEDYEPLPDVPEAPDKSE